MAKLTEQRSDHGSRPLEGFFRRIDNEGLPKVRFTREQLVAVIRDDRESGHED